MLGTRSDTSFHFLYQYLGNLIIISDWWEFCGFLSYSCVFHFLHYHIIIVIYPFSHHCFTLFSHAMLVNIFCQELEICVKCMYLLIQAESCKPDIHIPSSLEWWGHSKLCVLRYCDPSYYLGCRQEADCGSNCSWTEGARQGETTRAEQSKVFFITQTLNLESVIRCKIGTEGFLIANFFMCTACSCLSKLVIQI